MTEVAAMTEHTTPAAGEFLITKEYRRFAEFCDAVRRDRYIGLCYGPPGVGKTLSARHYANWDTLEHTDIFDPTTLPPPTFVATCRTVVYTAPVSATPGRVEREVLALCCHLTDLIGQAEAHARGEEEYQLRFGNRNRTELLIVDEADRLKMLGLEQVRDFYDQDGLGVVLIGMPGIEKRLARYAQLYSRVGFVHAYRSLSDEELQFILAQTWRQLGSGFDLADFTDQEALTAVRRITGGNFRLLRRLLALQRHFAQQARAATAGLLASRETGQSRRRMDARPPLIRATVGQSQSK
jgi:DNA transposition AAA+ family ATPase